VKLPGCPKWNAPELQEAGRGEVTALEYFKAALMPDYGGWWVYALGACDADPRPGHVFYAGQSEHLLRRVADHANTYRQLFDPARVWLVKVRDQARADLVELELIEFYQPEYNAVGRADVLRARLRRQNKPLQKGSSVPVRLLDSGQETG
jgi:hypothetical protein